MAKGTARPDSDLDFLLVVTDEAYAARSARGEHWVFHGDITDYEGGYADGKLVDLAFLEDVAQRGSEVARSAFVGAFAPFTRLSGLAELLRRIPVYPEQEREEKMKAFFAQALILHWYIGEGEKRKDRYLLTRAAADLSLYGGRAVLAYNRILFPFHKWFIHALETAPEKPAGLLELTRALLDRPCRTTSQAYLDALAGWRDWGVTHQEAVVRFMQDTEWNWRNGRAPLNDW